MNCSRCGGALLPREQTAGVCGFCSARAAGLEAPARERGRPGPGRHLGAPVTRTLDGAEAAAMTDARADLSALAEKDRRERRELTEHLRRTGVLPTWASQRAARGLASRFRGGRHAN